MNQEILQQYYELEKQLQDIEEKKSELKKQILLDMQKEEQASVKEPFGTFSIVKYRKFYYTDEVKKKEEEVKILKKTEEELGIAKVFVYDTLRFQTAKPQKDESKEN